MTKNVFEEMLEFTTMEDIDSLMRVLRQSSIMKMVQHVKEQKLTIPPYNKAGRRTTIWLCGKLPRNLIIDKVWELEDLMERDDLLLRYSTLDIVDLRSRSSFDYKSFTKGDFLILDTGEVFEVIKLWK